MRVIDILDKTTDNMIEICLSGKLEYIGSVDMTPYKYLKKEVIGIGTGWYETIDNYIMIVRI